jgi:hypothetical protein
MKKHINISLIALCALLLTNCSSENRDWAKAKKQHTIKDYNDFIAQYPKSIFADSAKNQIDQMRPEVTFYAEDRMGISLNVVFDPSNSGRLCEKAKETVFLKTPSDSVKPWTFLNYGKFNIVIDDKHNIEYGYYQFVKVISKDVERIIAAFERKGKGEKWIGAAAGDGNLFTFDEKGKSIIIGQCQYMKIKSPVSKDSLTVIATRMVNPNAPWITYLGNKIFSIEKDGLTQIGWFDWRKIVTHEGTTLVILMTKGVDKDAKWAGRYDGKLYKDK